MVNLGSMDDSRYTGFREITDRDVLDLQCTPKPKNQLIPNLVGSIGVTYRSKIAKILPIGNPR